jgi:hypothetical protein
MKKLLFISALLFVTLGYSQKKEKPFATYISEPNITSLMFSVDSMGELKTINWKDIKEIFSSNSKNQKIELAFEFDLAKSRNTIKGSFKVGGESKDIDNLIKRAKKLVKGMVKIINKNK